jgi:hypothetical protein
MRERDLDLEEDCPGLKLHPYRITSPVDPKYNCVAFAVGDLNNFWDAVGVRGYYWPSPEADAGTVEGWIKVFQLHGYSETYERVIEAQYEKIAIYATEDGPQHVARQKASGIWTSKMGKGVDAEHTLEALEGELYGTVVKIMRRKCKDGKRVLET